jgi:hypothetical protein
VVTPIVLRMTVQRDLMSERALMTPFFKGLALARPLVVCVLDGTGFWNCKNDEFGLEEE